MTVTKTFELTLNGTVPADQAFLRGVDREGGGRGQRATTSCSAARTGAGVADTVVSDEDCVGDGTVYRRRRRVAAGTERLQLRTGWRRI
jgi:hypothetical protein